VYTPPGLGQAARRGERSLRKKETQGFRCLVVRMPRVSRLEDRVRPNGGRAIVIWRPDEPRPEVPEGADLIRVVYENRTESGTS